MNRIKDKRILITGACGTVGSALVDLLLGDEDYGPAEIIGIDNNESELFFLDQRYRHDERARFFVGDIRDLDKMIRRTRGIDVIFHSAALKHVVLCERSPYEAVQSNILGVQNIIHAADDSGVGTVIFTSSDKAVNPTNVMGTSKLMGERLMTAASSGRRDSNTIYASTRFGNVLGSSGSVVPIFRRQIEKGGPVTVTDNEMTRFVMSVEEAVRLVIDSANIAHGGEVFITKMPSIRIADLAAVMIEELAGEYGHKPEDFEIEMIGSKPGEKLYEELMTDEETVRARELQKYFCVLPAFRGLYRDIAYKFDDEVSTVVDNPYLSRDETPLTHEELRSFLYAHNLLDRRDGKPRHPDQRYWPGDK